MTREWDIRNNAAWSFETERFFVGFYAEDEELDPADSFDFQEDIDAVHYGEVEWFCAHVGVFLKSDNACDWREIGSDYLGACAYRTVREFYTNWRTDPDESRNTLANKDKGISICHYFPDMVRSAIREARLELKRMGAVAKDIHA